MLWWWCWMVFMVGAILGVRLVRCLDDEMTEDERESVHAVRESRFPNRRTRSHLSGDQAASRLDVVPHWWQVRKWWRDLQDWSE